MSGSPKYLIVPTKNFERWLKRLTKYYKGSSKQAFQLFIFERIAGLCIDPRPSDSAPEPIPGKMTLPDDLEFRKIRFTMPELKRDSGRGKGRLMYLINTAQNSITLVWIYTHEEFKGRPDAKSLIANLQGAIDSLEETDSSENPEEQATSDNNSSDLM
ncbi:MAG: hypothetical protein HC895_18220 [Leptolyngbyaceae cyanobacterium SM1_3_5]|nr:hypothetical protein [Leptolyngbyaceae cyanobacterium SM1_3_5]